MNKSVKGVVAIAVIAALYLGATSYASTAAHERVEEFTKYVTSQSNGMLRIAETKSTRGFFSSTEDVTSAFDNPMLALILGAAAGAKPLQFTIHNVIQHGPVPGLRSIGIARVQSTLVMDDATRKLLIDTLGTDQPLELSVTFGFAGATRLDINSPAMTFHAPGDKSTFNWKGMKSHIDYSKDFTAFTSAAAMPGLFRIFGAKG
jgi:uncharacterized protein YdgA (DUF945 family)